MTCPIQNVTLTFDEGRQCRKKLIISKKLRIATETRTVVKAVPTMLENWSDFFMVAEVAVFQK